MAAREESANGWISKPAPFEIGLEGDPRRRGLVKQSVSGPADLMANVRVAWPEGDPVGPAAAAPKNVQNPTAARVAVA